MDLTTLLRNVKAHKYKCKADFASDVDLIWQNCYTYNTTAVSVETCKPDRRTTRSALSQSFCSKRRTICWTLLPTAMTLPTIRC